MRQLKLRIPTALAILSLLVLAPVATAADEVGDAGDLPATAQDLTGAGVDTINGTVAGFDRHRHVPGLRRRRRQLLRLVRRRQQRSTRSSSCSTPSGRGVYANDDQSDGVVQSLLPAGHALTPQAPGEYYLAVGAYNLDPLGADEPIFGPGTGVVGPTGLGGGEPVSGWGGRPGGPGPYTLTLTGRGARRRPTPRRRPSTCAAPPTAPW